MKNFDLLEGINVGWKTKDKRQVFLAAKAAIEKRKAINDDDHHKKGDCDIDDITCH